MKRLDVFLLLLLGAVWGSSYTFVRIALPFLSPVFIMSLRIVLAAVVLTALLAGFADLPDFRKNWRAFLFMGAVNNAVPFIMVGAAVAGLNASIAAILNATSPLFTAMIAAVWIKEPFGPRRILGTLLGILGVVTLMGWNPLPLTPKTVVGAAAALGAAFLFGVAAVYGRLRLKGRRTESFRPRPIRLRRAHSHPGLAFFPAPRRAARQGGSGRRDPRGPVHRRRLLNFLPPPQPAGSGADLDRHFPHSLLQHPLGFHLPRRTPEPRDVRGPRAHTRKRLARARGKGSQAPGV